MSPLDRARLLLSLLILSVACSAVEPDRTNRISQMPPKMQEKLFEKILGDGNIQLNENHSLADITRSGRLPEIINSLANGAIDALVSQIPGIGTLLGPLITGGLDALFSSFGKKKVYIPNMPPVISCPQNIEVPRDKGRISAIVQWTEPFGFDAEDGRITKVIRNGRPPGSRFSAEERVQYTVYDSKGRSDTCFMYIKVKIASAPEIINCPGFTLKYADRGKSYTVVTWADIIATDSNNENVTVTQVKGPPSGSKFAIGAHQISYEAVDNVGLKDTCTFFVNVEVRMCPVPELSYVKLDIHCGGPFQYGSACTLSCIGGMTLQGSSRITCEKNGNKMEWSYPNGQPTCIDPIRSVWVSTTPLPTGLKTGSSSVFALVGSNITASSDLAVDGIKSENFFSGDCFLSNTGDLNPIWIVDLSRAYHVYSVTILNRSHLSKTTVDVMQNNPLNGAAGTSTHCGTVTNESAGATSPVVCEHKTVRQNQTYVPVFPAGRYIRLQKAGEYLLLCEVTIHVVAEQRNEVKFRIPTDK